MKQIGHANENYTSQMNHNEATKCRWGTWCSSSIKCITEILIITYFCHME